MIKLETFFLEKITIKLWHNFAHQIHKIMPSNFIYKTYKVLIGA